MIGLPAATMIGAGISALGNVYNARSAQRANVHAMRNRHQWEVADLKAAGLNPILSARNSGTPGLPGVMAQMPNFAEAITSASQAESNIQKQEVEVQKIKEEIEHVVKDLTEAQVNKLTKEAINLASQADLAAARAQAQDYENIRDAVRVKYSQDREWMLRINEVSKQLGVGPKEVLQAVGVALGAGIFKGTMKPKTTSKSIFYDQKGRRSLEKYITE
jgi:predicted transcriptional regulator